jgi:hypothetical protein
LAVVHAARQSGTASLSAAQALVGLGEASARIGIEALADPTAPAELGRAIITALDDNGHAKLLVAALDTLKGEAQQAPPPSRVLRDSTIVCSVFIEVSACAHA